MSELALPVKRLLRLASGSRVVFQTELGGQLAVARVATEPAALDLDDAVKQAVHHGADAPPLSGDAAVLVHACAARASLAIMPGLPELLDVGIGRLALPGRSALASDQGYVYALSRWQDGPLLSEAASGLDLAGKLAALSEVLRILERMHGARVCHGRVRARGIAVAHERIALVELEGMRRVALGDPLLAEDIYQWGEKAGWLLGSELARPAPWVEPWQRAIAACMQPDADLRPTAAQLAVELGVLAATEVGAETISVADPAHHFAPVVTGTATQFVPDDAGTQFVPDDAGTQFVPDDAGTQFVADQGRPAATPTHGGTQLAIVALVLALVIAVALWLS